MHREIFTSSDGASFILEKQLGISTFYRNVEEFCGIERNPSFYVEGGGKEFKKVEHFNFIHMYLDGICTMW